MCCTVHHQQTKCRDQKCVENELFIDKTKTFFFDHCYFLTYFSTEFNNLTDSFTIPIRYVKPGDVFHLIEPGELSFCIVSCFCFCICNYLLKGTSTIEKIYQFRISWGLEGRRSSLYPCLMRDVTSSTKPFSIIELTRKSILV